MVIIKIRTKIMTIVIPEERFASSLSISINLALMRLLKQ